ncbi:hypothetical protein K438DRAFT_1967596 [Mycena galopus ATCC 62051]|nr:hypothetical protein K438DRAFT_1967596 [Mycena galopus ATCC 62051]
MRLTECNEYCAATAALSQARAASARCTSSISRGVRSGDHTPTAKAASLLHGASRPAASVELSSCPTLRTWTRFPPVALLTHTRTNSAQRQIAHAARGLGTHDAVVSAASLPQPALRTLLLHPHPPDLMPLASALLLHPPLPHSFLPSASPRLPLPSHCSHSTPHSSK